MSYPPIDLSLVLIHVVVLQERQVKVKTIGVVRVGKAW
eukprot:CAMPEP_0170790410 /NCGR_PEP_ID=MMETSP0733-20121128/20405_1 /TAXON_ID=186038 /ORGANISM="Fragilariopsis kerguelensis, Strain L26-C5" /LENGTH=37 /DNA_ID= /DNA_START= /DNA_END= /DNA_ORIENTATION=